MQSARYKILFITKWYLHRNDPQFAVFINKHAKSIAAIADIAVLHVMSDENMQGGTYNELVSGNTGLLNVQIYFRKNTGYFSSLVNGYRYFKGIRRGLTIIRNKFGDYDLVHAYILLRPAVVAWWLKLTRGKKYIISEQWSGFATGKFLKRNFFIRWLTALVVRQAEAVTTVSRFLKESMIRSGLNSNYFIVPNIIEIPVIKTIVKPAEDPVKILVVADLVDEIKNISGTIRAFGEVCMEHENSILNIIGHGKDEMLLKNLVRELGLEKQIFFHGVKSNDEVYKALLENDFLVVNSNFETFSLICAEALSCGKPVIATRCGGPQEFVTDETGILTEPGNHRQLAEAIQKMMADYKKYQPEKLISYAAERFSSDVVSRKFYDVYASVLENKSS